MNDEILVIETEHGIFTENKITGETPEEVYQSWLDSQQIDICPDNIKNNEILTKENEQLWQTVEFLLKQVELIPKEVI